MADIVTPTATAKHPPFGPMFEKPSVGSLSKKPRILMPDVCFLFVHISMPLPLPIDFQLSS